MASLIAQLKVEILTPWHLCSGREGGAYADSLVNKDTQGLPVLNGKSLKGLLRAACQQSMELEWVPDFTESDLDEFFGREGTDLYSQGVIEVSSARLSEGEQAYFVANPEAIKFLYPVVQNTAIDHKTGTAKDTSLRSIETVVPMTLNANLYLNAKQSVDNELFFNWLKVSLPLINAVGGKRRRGFGEAILSINKEAK